MSVESIISLFGRKKKLPVRRFHLLQEDFHLTKSPLITWILIWFLLKKLTPILLYRDHMVVANPAS